MATTRPHPLTADVHPRIFTLVDAIDDAVTRLVDDIDAPPRDRLIAARCVAGALAPLGPVVDPRWLRACEADCDDVILRFGAA